MDHVHQGKHVDHVNKGKHAHWPPIGNPIIHEEAAETTAARFWTTRHLRAVALTLLQNILPDANEDENSLVNSNQ